MLCMAKVGADKRLNYYQIDGKKVVSELNSHPYGLTHPEASHRLTQNGVNQLATPLDTDKRWVTNMLPLLGMLTLAGVLSAADGDGFLLAIIVTVALISVLGAAWREQQHPPLADELQELTAGKATVRRNDVLEVIDAERVVLGDIIELSAGTIVPADIRLLDCNLLLVDEHALFGSTKNVAKYAHALDTDAPLQHRNNLALAGSTVVSGSGTGVVIATGMQTELGRIVAQTSVQPAKISRFHKSLLRISKTLAFVAFGLLAVTAAVGYASSFSPQILLTTVLAVTLAAVPVGLTLAATDLFIGFSSFARRRNFKVINPAIGDRLSQVKTFLIDESPFIIEPTPTVSEVLIGKALLQTKPTGYQPKGVILNKSGKPVGTKTLGEYEFFFEAAALSSNARLLPPDGNEPTWHTADDNHQAALQVLAAKGGVDIENIRQRHPFVAHRPYDHVRGLTSYLHEYDHRTMLFMHGDTPSVLARSSKLWDGGHTRTFTKSEQQRLLDYHEAHQSAGNTTLTVAYRQIKLNKNAPLDMSKAEEELTVLGVVVISRPPLPKTANAIRALQSRQVAISVITKRSQTAALATARELNIADSSQLRVVSNQVIQQLSDAQLAEVLAIGGNIFTHLSPDNRLRLIDIAERGSQFSAVTCASLVDLPAARRASVAVSSLHTHGVVAQQSDVLLAPHLEALASLQRQSGRLATHLRHIIDTAITNHSTQLWLVTVSLLMLVTWHIPLAISALLLLSATLISALPLATLGEEPVTAKETRNSPLLPHPLIANISLGFIASLLIIANFLLYYVRQDLSPSYIENGSVLHSHSITLAFVTLMVLMWIDMLFARTQHTTNVLRDHLYNASLRWITILAGVVALAIIYLPGGQSLFSTKPLDYIDWLSVALFGSLYFAIRYLAHKERITSREQIINLHHEVHGRGSKPRI